MAFEPVTVKTFVCDWTIGMERHDGGVEEASGFVSVFDGSEWRGTTAEYLTPENLREIAAACASLADYLEANPVDEAWIAKKAADDAWLALPESARQQALAEQAELRAKNQAFDIRKRARQLAEG